MTTDMTLFYTIIDCIVLIPISLIVSFVTVVMSAIIWRFFRIVVARRNQLEPTWSDAIFITGATSGIGLVVAKRMFELGYSVIVGYYDASQPGFKQLHNIYDEARRNSSAKTNQQLMFFIDLDVRNQDSIVAAYDQVDNILTNSKLRLHALVNNAGLGCLQPFAWIGRPVIKSLNETNIIGVELMSREFLPLLIKAKGRLINVSSGLAYVKGRNFSIYGASKAAMVYFTEALNTEIKPRFGVQCVAIMPDNFIKATDICAQNMRNNIAAWDKLKPMERNLYQAMYDEHTQMSAEIDNKYRNRDQSGSDWIQMTDGSSALENSGMLTAFEDAVRLRHPPELLFAGSKAFSLLTGSLIVCLPHSLFNTFTSKVSDSLYK